MSENQQFPQKLFYILTGIETIIAMVYLAIIPVDPKNVVLWGYSANRLILFGVMILILISSIALLSRSFKKNEDPKWIVKIRQISEKFFYIFPIILLFCWILIFFPAYRFGKYEVIFSRIQPLLVLFAIIIFQFFILLKIKIQKIESKVSFLLSKKTFFIFTFFLIFVWLFLIFTRIGLDIDHDFWGGAATPILPLVLIISVFIPFYFYFIFKNNESKYEKLIKLFPILLFFFAIIVWNLEPFTPHFFAPKVRPPNFEYYPYSDAQIYDMTAQSLLSGEGYFNRGHVQRPLYGFMLFVFHKIMGQNYLNVVFLQTILYALFPVLLFYLGRRLFSPTIGMSVGVLAVLRELTALQASPFMEIVHSKLYMTDIWASFFALLITFLVVIWYLRKSENHFLLILIGFVSGLSLLMRVNLILILIPVFILIFLKQKLKFIIGFKRIAILGLSIFVILIPWMTRNYLQVGEFGIEPQKFRMVIETRFDIDGNNSQQAPQTEPIKPSPMVVPQIETNRSLSKFDLENILNIARFTTANFLHNEIHSILIFPNSIFMESITGIIRQNDYIQETWTGDINLRQFIAIIINLCLMGMGISISVKKFGWFGLFPLAIHLFYNLSNGFARVSGWRYVIVTDWVIILYYLTGFLFVFSVIFQKLNLLDIKPVMVVITESYLVNVRERTFDKKKLAGIVLVLAISIGMILPEWFIKPRYQGQISKEQFLQIIKSSKVDYDPRILEEISSKPNMVFIHTKAFYPRYYYKGEGESGFNIEWLLAKEYGNLGFMVVSPFITGVTMELDVPWDYFPNDTEVLIIGNWVGSKYTNYLNAESIFLPNENIFIIKN